jgi:hypothetical protein
MNRQTKRYKPSRWSEILVPLVLFGLLLVLVGTILFVILSALGLINV